MHDRHALPGEDVIVDGMRLHVADHGRRSADRPPLLLLHGIPTTSYLWHDVARDLEHDQRCVMPDLVGLGASESPADRGAYSLHRQAATMFGLLDALGIERVAIAGHDIGGTVAVQMAALAPERVSALALLTPLLHADVWPVRAALLFVLPVSGELAVSGLQRVPRLGSVVLRRALDPAMPDEECAHYLTPIRTAEGGAGLLRVFRAIDVAGAQAALPMLGRTPTLVLWGESDPIHPLSYGHRVAASIPGSTWVPVAGGGHLLPSRMPQRVAEELRAFLAEADAR